MIASKDTLDLRFNGQLNPEVNPLFNKISHNIRYEFNDLITELSRPNIDNLDWWVNELPSRNTFASPFFHYFCCIHFINHLTKNSDFKYEKIIVDTISMKKVLDTIFSENTSRNCEIIYDYSLRLKVKQSLKKYFGNLYVLLYNILNWIIANFSRISNAQVLPHRSLVLIDSFVLSGYTNSNRWYGSLWENLTNDLKDETYFVSAITETTLTNLFSIYSDIRNNDENYIIKEDYIHINDYYFAFRYKHRLRSLNVKNIKIFNFDISGIINECINNPTDIFTIHESLITYRFIRRLKEKKIQVRLAIDWFEGHIIDKAWNLGFHTFYPRAQTIAYRAFQSFALYLCSYPIPIEAKAGVVPKVFALQGSKTAESVKVFYPELKTILIPAYKADHVWRKTNRNGSVISNNIIVALTISIKTSGYIISVIKEICNNEVYLKNNFKFIIKTHPTHSLKQIKKYLTDTLPSNVYITKEKSFPTLLHTGKVLITEASSTCLEAIAIGVPVIIIKRSDGLFHSPLPEGIDEILYKVCSSKNDIHIALNKYLFMSKSELGELIYKSHKVRENYFQPITIEGTNRLMDVNQKMNYNYA